MSNQMQFMTDVFGDAKQVSAKYIAVQIRMDGYEKDEIIINEAENIDKKLAYYQNTYDENLLHKHAAGIKIIDFTYANTYAELEKYFG